MTAEFSDQRTTLSELSVLIDTHCLEKRVDDLQLRQLDSHINGRMLKELQFICNGVLCGTRFVSSFITAEKKGAGIGVCYVRR